MIWNYWPFRQLWCRLYGHNFRLATDDSAPQYRGWIVCANCLKVSRRAPSGQEESK